MIRNLHHLRANIERDDGTLLSNPNVLVEYGDALNAPGDHCIVAVLKSTYGVASEKDVPFNLRGRRWPIEYELVEDATPEDRKATRKVLTGEVESAHKLIVGSAEFQAKSSAARIPTSLEVARSHRDKVDFQREIDNLISASEESRIRQSVQHLLHPVNDKLTVIESSFGHGLEFGFATDGSLWMAVRAGNDRTFHVSRQASAFQRREETKLTIRKYLGWLLLPGEPFPQFVGQYQQPNLMGEEFCKPSLSAKRELGWSLQAKGSP